MHELLKEISDKIARNNANYELRADVRNILNFFNAGEVVKKLNACSANIFQILNKLNDNVYVINFDSSTLNVKDLVDYKGVDFILLVDEPFPEPIFESLSLPPLQDILLNTTNKVDKILDDEIITTNCDGGTQRYLILWKGTAPTDDA